MAGERAIAVVRRAPPRARHQQLTCYRQFGSWVASFDVSHLSGRELHDLLAVIGGTESQLAVCRSNVLAQIKLQGGDPIDSQKKSSKSSHSSSKKNADTSNALEKLPNVKEKMADGAGMSSNKAALLAGAAKKTSLDDVNDDPTLLDKVERQDEDKAKQTIDKWVRDRQSHSSRKSQRQKNIDERQFWMFIKDGMVHSHGKAPADVRNMARYRRWQAEKSRLWRLDGGRDSAHRSVRSDEQRGADAYDNMLDGIDGQVGGLRDRADWCADVDNSPEADASASAQSESAPGSAPNSTSSDDSEATGAPVVTHRSSPPATPAPPPATPSAPPAPASSQCHSGAPRAPARTQIVVVVKAENDALDIDDPEALADIVGGGPLLRSELDRHKCNAEIYGMLFDHTGKNPLWAGRAIRYCTDAQWRALLVRDGGCVLTDADPTQCEAHHMTPYEAPAKGRSDITNLVMVSVSVHHWLHDNHLTI